MSLQAVPTFEESYAGVPAVQVERLKEFRRTHPLKRLAFGATQWEYIACGRGDQVLLLLPGALSIAESTFPMITAFQDKYRIIAPSYALAQTMTGLCEGIANIFAAEDVNRAHVIGGSYGGLVAQYFVRLFPQKTCSLVLSHTFLITPKLELPLTIAGRLLPLLPAGLFVPLLKLRLNKLLLSTLRRRQHPEYEFWKAYLNEAVAPDRFREVAVHQQKCLLDMARQPQFTADDLKAWYGKILIIESDDDPAIPAKDRALLRKTYPQAQVKTFSDAGHASSILKRNEVFSMIKRFLSETGRIEESQ